MILFFFFTGIADVQWIGIHKKRYTIMSKYSISSSFLLLLLLLFWGAGGGRDGEGQSTITMFQFLSQQEEQFLSQMFGLIKWFVDVIVSIPSLLGSLLESG